MEQNKGNLISFRPDIKVVDCRLRDGGLVNNFAFSDEFVKDLYRTNIQFGLGGGLEWDRYRLQAGYDFGLNNIMRTPGIPSQKAREWGWMCTFAYKL